MTGIINNLVDGLFGLIIVGLFVAFIWARVQKKPMGTIFNDLLGWFNGEKKLNKSKEEVRQIWPRKTMT